ncbi:MAG: hypothetical protein M0Q26_15030 [Chitinophagaceae bacterium]|nr:hypothetical protein [Chitinophagaceae bacterium]
METTILGLSFSTRMLGLAVFKSNTLIDYSLKLHKEMWSPQKRDLVLASLASCIKHYTITDIALSIPDEHQQTKAFKELQEAIEGFARNHDMQVTLYTAKEVYQRFGSPVKRTRNALMTRLVLLFPELSLYFEREKVNRNKYYVKLFEAIAVAAYHSQEK